MSIDRAELEKAISLAEDAMAKGDVRCRSEMQVLIDASRAHLSTLPQTKMVWHVSDAEGSTRYDDPSDAYKALWPRLMYATSDVTIGRREVPV